MTRYPEMNLTDDGCPACGTTSVQQLTSVSPVVVSGSCAACQLHWALTAVNPQPFFDRLAAAVDQLGAARSVLRAAIALAEEAATLTDGELRDRLLALADRACR
ncbi:MAG: hypothetical protein ACRDTH_05005 [Pseudonocardiaceae bacterium]